MGKGISGLGVSITSVLKPREKEEKREEKQEVLTESFTPLQLIDAWKQYAESIQEEHHLKNTMLNCLPSLLNNKEFEVAVNNPVQEQRLLDHATDILTSLRISLKNTLIVMKVRITEENEKHLAYTNPEKFNLMVSQNPSIQKLKDEFGLEFS